MAALIALTMPAAADPVTLGTIVVAGFNAVFGAGTLTASATLIGTITVAQVVGTVISTGIALGLSLLSRPGKGSPIDPGAAKTPVDLSESPARYVLGRAKVGLVKFYGNSSGFDTYRLGGLSVGPISGIEEYYLGGRSVVVEADGIVSSPPFAKPGGSYINIKTKIGDGLETAWSELISAFPSHWTSNHRVRGIAQALMKCTSPGAGTTKFLKIRPSGAWPDLQVVLRGQLIYDPRTDSTAWSDNGILACLHVFLLFPGRTIQDCDLDIISAEADRADEIVSTRTGTEPRSRVWGVFEGTGIGRADLLAQVMRSAGVEMLNISSGKVAFRLIDDNREPEIHIEQDHIRKCGSKVGKDGIERFNICRLKYYSPERNYELSEIDLIKNPADPAREPLDWAVVQDEIDRVGEQIFNVELPFCPSPSQAQRITRRLFAEERGERFKLTTDRDGLAAFTCKTISFDTPYADAAVKIEIEPIEYDFSQGEATINGVVQPVLTAWNHLVDEAMPPDTLPEVEFDSELTTPATATESAVITYPASGGTYTRFGYADIGSSMTVEANYRIVSGGIPGTWQSMSEYRAASGRSHAYVAADLSGQSIEFRVRYFNAAEDGSKWSTTYSVTPAANNAGPGAPSVSIAAVPDTHNYTVTVTAPTSLQVSYIVMSGSLVPASTTAIKPGEIFTISVINAGPLSPGAYTATATPHASDGTAGTPTTATLTIVP